MVYVNEEGYLERKTKSTTPNGHKPSKRDWWLVKYSGIYGHCGIIGINTSKKTNPCHVSITIPKKYVGKRVRFKLEVLK